MTGRTVPRYTLLPRPLAFDRRALAELPHYDRLSVELEQQLSAVQRRRSLGDAIRFPRQRYQAAPGRRPPS